jgi:hypothetical protein
MKACILGLLILCNASFWAQTEVFDHRLVSTFDFYMREAGLDRHPFELHFYRPDLGPFPDCQSWGEEGFGVLCNKQQIAIYGYTEKALKYGLYSVFQQVFGMELYQAEVFQKPKQIPNKLAYQKYSSVPAFQYREVFYGETRRSGYADWHKLTSGESAFTFENHPGWGLWVHTLHRLLPPSIYFDAHPDYYALRNGIRMKDQVCLSNPAVLDAVCSNLAKEIAKNPKAIYWSVSQMDNYNYCECNQCRHTDSLEQSHAGTMLRFVNEVAKRFPDKIISTLAYQYTRQAPVLCKPLPNVNIMLCTIEENRARSLRGTSFEKDLQHWSALTHNLLIWDYVINFSHMVMPFPNWPTLQTNIQLFQENGVQLIFEQGYNSPESEMQALRSYLLSKWIWDPKLNADSLIYQFTEAYYGPAGGIVREVLRTQVSELQKSGLALTLYEPPITHVNGYLSPENLRWYLAMYEKAKTLPGLTPLQRLHLELAEQGVRYALLEISKSPEAGTDWIFSGQAHNYETLLNDFVRLAEANGPKLLHEVRLSPAEYQRQTLQFWKEAHLTHQAVGAQVRYCTLPSSTYANGLELKDTISSTTHSTLTDGYRATLVYQKGWQAWQGKDAILEIQLVKPLVLDSIRIHYLANNQSWIMGPRALKASGQTQQLIPFETQIENPFCNQAQQEGAYPLVLSNFPHENIQQLRIQVVNSGKLPKWRGIDGDAWLFIDEIEVYRHEK